MLRNKSFRKQSRKVRLFMLFGSFCTAFIIILFTSYRQGNIRYIAEDTHFASRKLLNTSDSGDDSLYPPDAFTDEQLKNGAVVLHVIGLIYMFIALAIVCDEFFVPALGVIIERFKITEDVAGATFMAAGGSAPELFTSLFGIFFAKNNVGIGTIVGSAVFNILFVIGMCAIFSKTVLNLTWWPLFRDVTFYSIDLILLIAFFYDEIIEWYEALILFFGYIAYVLFMKFNSQIEDRVKSCLKKRCNKVETQERPERSLSMPILHAGGNRFRHGILDLIIHSNHHNLHEAKPHEKAVHLHALETLKVVIGVTTPGHGDHNGQTNHNGSVDQENNKLTAYTNGHITSDNGGFTLNEGSSDIAVSRVSPITPETPDGEDKKEELQEEEEPLDLSWPKEWRKRLNYILVAPIIFPLWIFLPDVRRPEKKRWFIITFFGSILWIAIYSYLMLWWAATVGKTIGIQDEIMGLTIIAAGTSIPDLITSVIVAKKGFGDMAVSSSVGSNIFDITVGLPIPWLIYLAINGGVVDVNSNGLVCSIFLLFVMLITVIATIAVSKWKMSKPLGGSMLVLYVVFVVLSVLLEVSVIKCPVT
ncbi:sodium/potassium/calcium exchanger Nckx30C-like [Mytilus edulis]|uniref:sodium/potassium/calcium exchanger Nckx30C-like n=1 Tax=Mytilus edulis TaxID=6550 RepID=UPI0039EF460D